MNGYTWANRSAAYRRGVADRFAQPGNPYREGTQEHADYMDGRRDGQVHAEREDREIALADQAAEADPS